MASRWTAKSPQISGGIKDSKLKITYGERNLNLIYIKEQ
jgi:hypothetical protein